MPIQPVKTPNLGGERTPKMCNKNVFELGQVCETADYFCKVTESGCNPNRDISQLMSALRTMAWVVQQLNAGSNDAEVRHRLTQECAAVAYHLVDWRYKMMAKGNN